MIHFLTPAKEEMNASARFMSNSFPAWSSVFHLLVAVAAVDRRGSVQTRLVQGFHR